MMKRNYLILLFFAQVVCAQQTDSSSSIFKLSVSYGPQYNNFVDYDQEIVLVDGNIQPLEGFPGEAALLQKREIGTYFNVTASLRIGGRNYIELGHSRTLNQGVYNGGISFPNGTEVQVRDFQLRHRNQFFKLGFKRQFSDNFAARIGISDQRDQRSVINIDPNRGVIQIAERNRKNSNAGEGVIYAGIEYNFYRSGRFTLGVQSTAYFIVTAGQELETFTIAPVLSFNF